LSSKRFRLGQQGAFGHFQGRKRIKNTVRSWKWANVTWWTDMERASAVLGQILCNVRVNPL